MSKITKYEMETVVNYNAGEQMATDKTYSMPKSYVTYRKPRAERHNSHFWGHIAVSAWHRWRMSWSGRFISEIPVYYRVKKKLFFFFETFEMPEKSI